MESSKSTKEINEGESQGKFLIQLGPSNIIAFDREGIIKIATDFYKNLYSSDDPVGG